MAPNEKLNSKLKFAKNYGSSRSVSSCSDDYFYNSDFESVVHYEGDSDFEQHLVNYFGEVKKKCCLDDFDSDRKMFVKSIYDTSQENDLNQNQFDLSLYDYENVEILD